MRRGSWIVIGLIAMVTSWPAPGQELSIGTSKVDVTPRGPVRLGGYAARKTEHEGVEQRLFARGLAIGRDAQSACVLVVLENVGMPGRLVEEVAGRLAAKRGLARERLAIICTHTHCSPLIDGTFANMFGVAIPADQQERIEAYTRQVADGLEKAAVDALADLKPGTLWLGRETAEFAANRRTKDGPVDHALPVLVAKGADGAVRAVVANYACHCTTMGGDFNRTSGDWAGYAAQNLEALYPGAVAAVSIGCGADANPAPRGKLDDARRHGAAISAAVAAAIKQELRPITSAPRGTLKRIELAWDRLPDKAQWAELARRDDAIGANAKIQLARLNAGMDLSRPLSYPVQSWVLGDELAWVFLAGEVVVDYSLRLQKEFDARRLIVTAYANDVPCYIPSRRILAEGGYEAEGAMTYYGRPGRLAPAVENDIVRAVHEVVPVGFRTPESINQFPAPRNVEEALKSFQIRAEGDLRIECMAAEPLIESPVAIDWDQKGNLWVLEMRDYPTGLHEDWSAGGRVKVLRDRDGDGRYDQAKVFCEGLNFPQGLMCWRKGVLVCAAPEIIYFEDEDQDGVAESRTVLFSGFSPDNRQWTVNGLAWGLDGWVYGASSIANDPIRGGGRTIELGARDFRMRPDTRDFEPVSGRTQLCRVRDDWGNWFGNDNSTPLWHYPMEERYVRRNPNVRYPPMASYVAEGPDPTRVYPISPMLERFNVPQSAGRVTSGCGPAIYRDDLLGERFAGNAFYCEPVHNLVQRLVLRANGATFAGRRAAANARSEFLSSSDNWFRPVQVKTGPDGGLWIVDMQRFVIEHPRWITPERLAMLDVRAGHDRGRIYRIVPGGGGRPIEKIEGSAAEVARRIDSPNGTVRDLAQRELAHRQDPLAVGELERIARKSEWPAARAQAAWALEGMGSLSTEITQAQMSDGDARVRRNGVRLAEGRLRSDPGLLGRILALAGDEDVAVRYQAALALGKADDPHIPEALSAAAASAGDDPWLQAAVLNAAGHRPLAVLEALAKRLAPGPGERLAERLVSMIAQTANGPEIGRALSIVLKRGGKRHEASDYRLAASVLDVMERRGLDDLAMEQKDWEIIAELAVQARVDVAGAERENALRAAAMRLLLRGGSQEAVWESDFAMIRRFLSARSDPQLQRAAVQTLVRAGGEAAGERLIEALGELSPAVRPEAMAALCARPAWAEMLLDAIERDAVQEVELPAEQRQRLLNQGDASLRARAQKLLGTAHGDSRAAVVEKHTGVLTMKGDPLRGAKVFEKSCAACHRLGGIGHAVGPDLSAISDRSPAALLTAILDPSAAINGQFIAYTIETADEQSFTGIIAQENAAGITLLMGNGMRQEVPRSQIQSISTGRLSLMPEGLEETASPQDLADVIAFVAAGHPPG